MDYKISFEGTIKIRPVHEVYAEKIAALNPVVHLPMTGGPLASSPNMGSAAGIWADNNPEVGSVNFLDGTTAPLYGDGAASWFGNLDALAQAWRSRDYTIAMWVQYLGEWHEDQEHLAFSVYGKGGQDFTRWGTRPTLGDFRCRQRQGGEYHVMDDMRDAPTREWHHLCMTYSFGHRQGLFWRDGVQVDREDVELPRWGAIELDSSRTHIGAGWTGGVKHIIRLDYALSGEEVLAKLATLT